MRRGGIITDKERATIVTLLKADYEAIDIAERFGITREAVYVVAKESGFTVRELRAREIVVANLSSRGRTQRRGPHRD